MLKKKTTAAEFNDDIARRTGSDIRIVNAALLDEKESKRFHKKVAAFSLRKNISNALATACFVGTIYGAWTTEIGYTETTTPFQVDLERKNIVTSENAYYAVFNKAAWDKNIERHFKSNLPQKIGLFFFLLGLGGAALIVARENNNKLQESRKDLRTMALIPQPKA